MISHDAICERLLATGKIEHIEVNGDGYHYQLFVVSNAFEGLSKVKRQQWVYQILNDWIASGELHAINMKTLTSAEWEAQENG